MTAPFTLTRLQDALVCLNDLHAAITLQTQDMGADQSEIIHGLLTDLANNLSCTVKPDKLHLVEMQRTERMLIHAAERHHRHIHADAANAEHLRRQLAERDDELATMTGRYEALQIAYGALEFAEEMVAEENSNLRIVLDRQASARSREAA